MLLLSLINVENYCLNPHFLSVKNAASNMIYLRISWKDIVRIPWSDQVSVNICVFIIITFLLNIASNNQHFLSFLPYNRKLIGTVVSGIELVELKSTPGSGMGTTSQSC